MPPLARLAGSSWPPMLATAGVLAFVTLRVQLPAADLVAYAAYLLLGIALPGTVVWRALLHRVLTRDGRQTTWFQDLSLGTVAGFAVQLPVYLVGVAIGFPLVVWLLPVLALSTLASSRTRTVWTRPTGRLNPWTAWTLAGTVTYAVVWFAEIRITRRPLSLRDGLAHVDETFHQALSAELLHHVPPVIPWVAGEPMNYHWFVHAQVAASRWATGLGAIEELRVVVPLTMITLTILALGAVAMHLTQRHAAAAIAPGLFIAGGFHALGPGFNDVPYLEAYLTTRVGSSPSFAYGILMSIPVFLLVAEVLQRRSSPAGWRTWLALTGALLAAGGAKATVMPVLVCASLGTWALMAVFSRRPWNAAAPLTGVVVATTLFTQYVVFGGRSPGLVIDLFQLVDQALRLNQIASSPLAWAAMLLSMLISWTLYGAGVVGIVRTGRWRDPAFHWMAIAVVTGLTVPLVLYRQGWSVLWFSRAIAPLVVLLGAWGIALLLPRVLRARQAVPLVALAIATGSVALFVSFQVQERSTTPQARADLVGLLVTAAIPVAIVVLWLGLRLLGRAVSWLPRPTLLVVLAALAGLSLVKPLAFAHEFATQRGDTGPVGKQIIPKDGSEAARQILRASDPDDLVATNAHCMTPKTRRCDNRHFWISAHSERRVLLEGWGYTGQSNAMSENGRGLFFTPTPFEARLAASDAAFEDPSRESIGRLVDEYGVDWLFVDKRFPVDMPGLRSLDGEVVEVTHESKNYAVFEITGP